MLLQIMVDVDQFANAFQLGRIPRVAIHVEAHAELATIELLAVSP